MVYMVSTVDLFVSTSTRSNRRCRVETWRNESILASKNDGDERCTGMIEVASVTVNCSLLGLCSFGRSHRGGDYERIYRRCGRGADLS